MLRRLALKRDRPLVDLWVQIIEFEEGLTPCRLTAFTQLRAQIIDYTPLWPVSVDNLQTSQYVAWGSQIINSRSWNMGYAGPELVSLVPSIGQG